MSEEDQFLRVRSQPKKPLLRQIFPGLIIKIGYQRFKRLLYPNNIVTSRPFILIPHTIDSLNRYNPAVTEKSLSRICGSI